MRLCLCLALVATCLAIDQNVGHLTPRNTQDAINLQIRCFVGIVSDYNNTSIGTEVFCDGLCGSISTSAGGYKFTTYNCFPTSFCSSAGLIETCATIQADRDLTGCCCGRDNCNVVGTNINTNIPMAPPEEPITCYSGLSTNGVIQQGSEWISCQGACISLAINTTMNGYPMVGTIFACDPTSVCSALNMVDRCNDIEPGIVRGCCCTTDACIDPTMNPPKEPRGPLSCYVGLYSRAASISVGQEVVCDGHCASFSAAVAGGDIVVFECVPKETCQALTLYNDCHTVQADRDITACCCDNANNCNAASYWLGDPNPYVGDFPIACYSGIRVNGQFITPAKWIACHGDCASIMINTTMAMGPMSAEILTCHPASVCNQLGIADNCAPVEAGVSACCCGYDACIDPTRFPNKYPGDPLKCYVGFQSTYNGGITVGSEVYCNGMCGALNAMVNGQNITTYMCTPRSICRQLELYDTWMPLPRDREVSALCCDNFNNCNVRDPSVDTTMPVRSLPEFPITCYSGIQVNGNWIANAGWESCNGNCASMNIVTQFAGQTHNLTVYKCDPSAVCEGLNMVNTCSSIQPGVSGCCCNTNACIDPTKNPAKTPANKLHCYVGLYAAKAYVNVGEEVYCNGKCASLRGMVNGDDVTTFQCVPTSTCRSLELDDACMPLPVNREFRVCCCDNVNSCNLALQNRTDIIVSPTPSPIVEYPISCWTGIYVNGSPLTEVGFQTCNGQCASITMNTTLSGLSHTASMYMCNPTAICKSLNMINNCSVLEPGLGGCCCNSDACIYPPRNKIPGIPLQCYVGLYAPNAGVNVGAEVVCDGQCFSLSGMINGDKVTTFHCAPLNICKSLELDNVCSGLRGDREITACCCDSSNSCNIAGYASVIAPPTAPPLTEFPIACWSGMYLNGAAITDAGYQSCSGSCASMTLQTTIFSNQHNVTLYACDPTSVCQALSMSNKCATVEPGVTGCCCDSDACLTPWKSPSNNLYAGLNTSKANTNDGGEERKTTDLKSRSRDV